MNCASFPICASKLLVEIGRLLKLGIAVKVVLYPKLRARLFQKRINCHSSGACLLCLELKSRHAIQDALGEHGAGLEVDLFWPASQNTRAIGAQLALHTSAGAYYRDVRATSGYLSGDAPQIHFGLPQGAAVQRLEVRWPDGKVSNIANPAAQTLIAVTR